jgi:glycogen debranching enzyme
VPPSRLFALKHGDTFVVADAFGDIGGDGDGLFHHDTRLLSRFRLSVAGRPLVLLGGATSEDSVLFTSNLTNRPLPPIGGQSTGQGVIHVERTRLIWEDRLYERLRLRNYGQLSTQLPLRLEFAADFRDMFEVRGLRRSARGRLLAAVVGEDSVVLSYEGLDGLLLTSALAFSITPTRISRDSAELELALPPQVRTDIFIEVGLGPLYLSVAKLAARGELGGGREPVCPWGERARF